MHGDVVGVVHGFLDRGGGDFLGDHRVQLGDDGRGRALGREEAEHRCEVGFGKALFGERCHVGLIGRALGAGGGQEAQLALLDQAVDGAERVAGHDLELRAGRVGHGLGDALVGYVNELGTGLGLDLLEHDVADRADARSRPADAARLGLGLRDHVFERLALERGGGHHVDGRVHHRHDGDEVVGLVGQLHQMRHQRDGADRGERQRVAVALGARHFTRAHGAARAALVVHDDRLAEVLADLLEQATAHRVGHATGHVGNHHADGARCGPGFFGTRDGGNHGGQGNGCAGREKAAAVEHGRSFLRKTGRSKKRMGVQTGPARGRLREGNCLPLARNVQALRDLSAERRQVFAACAEAQSTA